MPIETKPLRPGAPLDPADYDPNCDIRAFAPRVTEIQEELARAQVELMHAIARHRKAWQAMARFKRDHFARGWDDKSVAQHALDNSPLWKLRTGDVVWWRGEIQAQAAAVTALRGMLVDSPARD